MSINVLRYIVYNFEPSNHVLSNEISDAITRAGLDRHDIE